MENKILHKQLLSKYNSSIKYSKLDAKLAEEVETFFIPENTKKRKCQNNNKHNNCICRCKREYWIDHGLVTKSIMESIANKISKNEELYGLVGYLHDVDYLKYAHDINKGLEFKHPIPLVSYLNKNKVNTLILLALIEHAAYIDLYSNPTSYLSASLSAAEDLATLMSMENFKEYEKELSFEAKELANCALRPSIRININHEKPRIIEDINKYINIPLDIAINKRNVDFDF